MLPRKSTLPTPCNVQKYIMRMFPVKVYPEEKECVHIIWILDSFVFWRIE
jgi:hypothetical protein